MVLSALTKQASRLAQGFPPSRCQRASQGGDPALIGCGAMMYRVEFFAACHGDTSWALIRAIKRSTAASRLKSIDRPARYAAWWLPTRSVRVGGDVESSC